MQIQPPLMALCYGNWLYGPEPRANLARKIWNVPYDVPPLPATPEGYAELLYKTLHELDESAGGFASIAVEPVPEGADWDAVRDRLRRASAG